MKLEITVDLMMKLAEYHNRKLKRYPENESDLNNAILMLFKELEEIKRGNPY